jgi:hypothetical protein
MPQRYLLHYGMSSTLNQVLNEKFQQSEVSTFPLSPTRSFNAEVSTKLTPTTTTQDFVIENRNATEVL